MLKPDQLPHDHQALVPTEMTANHTKVQIDRVNSERRSCSMPLLSCFARYVLKLPNPPRDLGRWAAAPTDSKRHPTHGNTANEVSVS
jgi:hypothetical protein